MLHFRTKIYENMHCIEILLHYTTTLLARYQVTALSLSVAHRPGPSGGVKYSATNSLACGNSTTRDRNSTSLTASTIMRGFSSSEPCWTTSFPPPLSLSARMEKRPPSPVLRFVFVLYPLPPSSRPFALSVCHIQTDTPIGFDRLSSTLR